MATDAVPNFDLLPLTAADIADLRSDHAGEAGAVMIYAGILAVSKDPELRRFAEQHQQTEVRHLAFFDEWLPSRRRSRLLPVWRSAGWMLGAVAALWGRKCVFRTIAAVETFVDGHYAEQIASMGDRKELAALVNVLQSFRDDELEHRDDAAQRAHLLETRVDGLWPKIIDAGSVVGVSIARRL